MPARSVSSPKRSTSAATRSPPGAAGGELRAQVGLALARVAHRGPARSREHARRVEPGGRDHDALVLERARVGRHAARLLGRRRRRGARGWRRSRPARPPWNSGRDDRDVGQVRAAAVRVVEDPGVARARAPRRARPRPPPASRRGAPGCARPASPSGRRRRTGAVEASRRSLMFAECAERTSTAPISSQAARSAPTITWSVTGSSRSALHHHQVASARRASPAARPASSRAAARSRGRRPRPAAVHSAGRGSRRQRRRPGRHDARARACRALAPRPCRGSTARGSAGVAAATRTVTSSSSASASRSRSGLVRASNACAGRPGRARARRRPAARTPARRSAGRRWRAPRRPAAPSSSRPRSASRSTAAAIASVVRSSPRQQHALHQVAAALGDHEPERRQHAATRPAPARVASRARRRSARRAAGRRRRRARARGRAGRCRARRSPPARPAPSRRSPPGRCRPRSPRRDRPSSLGQPADRPLGRRPVELDAAGQRRVRRRGSRAAGSRR